MQAHATHEISVLPDPCQDQIQLPLVEPHTTGCTSIDVHIAVEIMLKRLVTAGTGQRARAGFTRSALIMSLLPAKESLDFSHQDLKAGGLLANGNGKLKELPLVQPDTLTAAP